MSAPANELKNLQKFRVIEMVFQPELKKERESYVYRVLINDRRPAKKPATSSVEPATFPGNRG